MLGERRERKRSTRALCRHFQAIDVSHVFILEIVLRVRADWRPPDSCRAEHFLVRLGVSDTYSSCGMHAYLLLLSDHKEFNGLMSAKRDWGRIR